MPYYDCRGPQARYGDFSAEFQGLSGGIGCWKLPAWVQSDAKMHVLDFRPEMTCF